LLGLSFIVLAGVSRVAAQTLTPDFETELQAMLKSASTVAEVERLHEKVDSREKVGLRASKDDAERYCHNLTNFVVLRVQLHRVSILIASSVGAYGPADTFELARGLERLSRPEVYSSNKAAFGKVPRLVVDNVESVDKRFAQASKTCAASSPVSDDYLSAKFLHTWLLATFRVPVAFDDRKTKDELTARIIRDYEDVLKAIRGRSSGRLDSVFMLYSYASFLLWRGNARFEEADLVLDECLRKAVETYGSTSQNLLPALRLKVGLANAIGERSELERLRKLIANIDPSIKAEEPVLIDITSRATGDSHKLLDSVKGVATVTGTKAELDAIRGKWDGKRLIATQDLPAYGPPMPASWFDPSVGSIRSYGRATIVIDVDERGIVRSADVQHSDERVRRSDLSKVALKLRFEPLIYKGRAAGVKGVVYLVYKWEYK
jgi:hypothetical protein